MDGIITVRSYSTRCSSGGIQETIEDAESVCGGKRERRIWRQSNNNRGGTSVDLINAGATRLFVTASYVCSKVQAVKLMVMCGHAWASLAVVNARYVLFRNLTARPGRVSFLHSEMNCGVVGVSVDANDSLQRGRERRRGRLLLARLPVGLFMLCFAHPGTLIQ